MTNQFFEITQDGFQSYHQNLADFKQGDFDLSLFFNKKPDAYIEEGIGYVYVQGPLVSNSAPIDRELGNTDYADIKADTQKVLANGAEGIVYIFNSPGGMVKGCIEIAEYVAGLEVPTVGLIVNQSCSASYKITSSCDWIIANKSADVGNIGAILVTMDKSKAMEAYGVKFVCFVNDGATLKSTGHLESLTETQQAFLQERANELGQAFQGHVLAQRKAISPEVFTAGWWNGQKAIDLGILDEVGDMDLAKIRIRELIELTK